MSRDDDRVTELLKLQEREKQRELEKKMRARSLEDIIASVTGALKTDPTAPLGRCELCGDPFLESSRGGIEHECPKKVAPEDEELSPKERERKLINDAALMAAHARVRRAQGERGDD